MDKILSGLEVPCLLDDILIASKSESENIALLAKVIARLDKYGLKVQKSKCFFLKTSIEYLGHVIDENGVRSSRRNVESVLNARRPSDVSELRSFLGLVNVHRKFLPNLSEVLHPLTNLLSGKVAWNWTSECERSYQLVKSKLTDDNVLAHYDPEKEVILSVDASPFGLGAVICHIDDGHERPIAFASRVLNAAETNYSQIEREGLAIIFGLQKFHYYLYGRKFTLYTDHKPLTMIFGAKANIPVLAVSR